MKDDKVISFGKEYLKKASNDEKESTAAFMKLVFDLTSLKLRGLQTNREDMSILDDLPYDAKQICQGINKASEFILSNYSNDAIDMITNLPDEFSSLAVSYITGNSECITLSDLDQI